MKTLLFIAKAFAVSQEHVELRFQHMLQALQVLDAKAAEADGMADPAKSAERLKLWSDVYMSVMDQAPWVPVFNEERYTMKSDRMGGEDALYVDPVSIPVNYDYVFVK